MFFPRRGFYQQNTFAFSTTFPFGFLEKSARVTPLREMTVYPCHRSATRFRRSAGGHRRRNRNPLPRPRARISTHPPVRGFRERPARGLEGLGACRQLQVREFAREQEQPWRCSWTARFREIWTPGSSTPSTAALSSRGAFQPAACGINFGRRDTNSGSRRTGTSTAILEVSGAGLSAGHEGSGGALNDTSYQIVFTVSPREFSEAGWEAHACSPPRCCPCQPRRPARKTLDAALRPRRPVPPACSAGGSSEKTLGCVVPVVLAKSWRLRDSFAGGA